MSSKLSLSGSDSKLRFQTKDQLPRSVAPTVEGATRDSLRPAPVADEALLDEGTRELLSSFAESTVGSSGDPYNTTVFVGGLSSLIPEDTLRSFFSPFGEIHYVSDLENYVSSHGGPDLYVD